MLNHFAPFVHRYKSALSEEEKKVREKISGAIQSIETSDMRRDDWSNSSNSSDEDQDNYSDDEREALPWEEKVGNDSGHLDEDSSEDVGSEEEERSNELEDTDLNWKSNLAEKAAKAFIERQSDNSNLWKLVYGKTKLTLPTVKSFYLSHYQHIVCVF